MNIRIKELRRKKGISQTKLGEILGVKQAAISDIENGVNNPTVSQIEKLSKFFNVTSDYLLFGIEPKPEIEPIEREIIEELVRKDADIKASLINFLDMKKNIMRNVNHRAITTHELMAA
jgi:transcriptional regulator with XRE-family HTH domain